jgi:tRNA-binding protein
MKYGLYYNHNLIGDILLVVFAPNAIPTKVIQKDNIVALYKDDELVGYNFLNISEDIKIKANGYIPLINHEVTDILNHMLKNAGLVELDYLDNSGFKVAKILKMEEHPDSDHLHICSVDVGEEKPLQIVCGSYNAKVGLKVVCAMPYSFMPNGQIIVPGELLGVKSDGMLCSGRELNLPGYDAIRGLYILDDNYKVGDDFFRY